ncbi:MAG: MJ1477/TM1410 family putative glycoside hydrolase [Thermoanaerobaculia bacterium]
MPRLVLVASLLALALFASPGGAVDSRLAGLNDWLYVLQPNGAASITAIGATSFDGVVMDYSSDGGASGEFTPAQVAALKATGKVVLAYLSIGEAEDYRWYWNPAWVDQGPPDPDAPSWLGPSNPDFPNNYKVRYWQPGWQGLLFGTPSGTAKSTLDRILDQGFDGIYLDIIDAFTFWSEDQGERTRLAARQDMVALVSALANYARVTRGHSRFLVFPQNGDDIILDDAGNLDALGLSYLAAIDGIGVEDVFYNELTPVPPAEVAFRTSVLAHYLAEAGRTRKVILVDYVWDAANPGGSANINRYNDFEAQAAAAGYVGYAAVRDRNLDEILTVAASGGFAVPQPKPGGSGVFTDGFETGDTSGWAAVGP